MKRLSIVLAVAALATAVLVPAVYAGNGAPSGAHFTLNIIGVQHDKNYNPKWNTGGRIFADLNGTTKIYLCESGDQGAGDTCPKDGFYVIDANGTDGSATFALPNPSTQTGGTCPTAPCTTVATDYSIFVRALTPKGESFMKLCGTDPSDNLDVCNTGTNILDLKKLQPNKFQNVTAQLLYLFDVTVNGTHYQRIQLFDPLLEGYYWNYDNHGLKLAQLRFYDCATYIGDTGMVGTACGTTGK